MKPDDSRAQKSEPHETVESTGRRDDDQVTKADATEASSDRPRDTADENAGGCSHPDLPAEESAAEPDNGGGIEDGEQYEVRFEQEEEAEELPEFEELTAERVATKAAHLEDQVMRLKSTIAILKSVNGVERPADEVGDLFQGPDLDLDNDFEYLLGLVGEAAREDIDDPYKRAAYVINHWCHELHHEPQNPHGYGPTGNATDGGEV